MFLLDINFILDVITGRSVNSDRYNKLLMELIESGTACISVSSIPTIEYITKKNYRTSLEKLFGLLAVLRNIVSDGTKVLLIAMMALGIKVGLCGY